jgi:hypothetical protein
MVKWLLRTGERGDGGFAVEIVTERHRGLDLLDAPDEAVHYCYPAPGTARGLHRFDVVGSLEDEVFSFVGIDGGVAVEAALVGQ